MNNRIQRLQFVRVGEDNAGQSRAVDASIRCEDIRAKFPPYLFVSRLSGRDQDVGHFVSIEYVAAEFAHHRGHGTFSAADAARQSNAQH